jgi:hypothetical protein
VSRYLYPAIFYSPKRIIVSGKSSRGLAMGKPDWTPRNWMAGDRTKARIP